jgi:hypothetical protein
MKTSPKSTSLSCARSAVELDEAKDSSKAALLGGVAGSRWRHVPSTAAVVSKVCCVHACVLRAASHATRLLGTMVVVTVAPGAVKPHTTACCGALCSTMCEPSVADTKWRVSSS